MRILTYFTLLLLLSRLAEAQHSETLTLSDEDKQWALDFTKNFTGGMHPVYLINDKFNGSVHANNIQFSAGFLHTVDFDVNYATDSISVNYLKTKQPQFVINPLVFKYNSENSIKKTLRHEIAHAELRQKSDSNFNHFFKVVNFKFNESQILQYGQDIFVAPAYFTKADKHKFETALRKDFEVFENPIADKGAFMELENLLNKTEYAQKTHFTLEPMNFIENNPQLKPFLNKSFSNSPLDSYFDISGNSMRLHAVITLKSYPNKIILCGTYRHLTHDFLQHIETIKGLFFQSSNSNTSFYLKETGHLCDKLLRECYFNEMPTLFSKTKKQKMQNNCVSSKTSNEIAARILELPESIQQSFFKHTSAYLHKYLNSSPDEIYALSTTATIRHTEL